jgi:hypothetical protein
LVPTAIARAAGKRIISSARLFRLLPPGQVKSLAAAHYHAKRGPEEVCRFLETTGTTPTRFYSAARIAAQAAFDTGRDDLAEEILIEAGRRFPAAAEVPLLRAHLRLFHGDYADALAHAVEARLLNPDWLHATAAVIWLHYLTASDDEADRVATAAMRRFPQAGRVLWAACRGCRSVEQFERFARSWKEAVSGPVEVLAGGRPLAAAAARAGLVDTAVEIYAEAILLWLHGYRPAPLATPRLPRRHRSGDRLLQRPRAAPPVTRPTRRRRMRPRHPKPYSSPIGSLTALKQAISKD